MSANLVVVILALLLGLQAVTTDLYLPALPAIREVFDASMGDVQLTLTALLLAFGISQLVWGPLSDRFGRRPILIGGLVAYVLASLACSLAPGMGWLIAARAVQGVAMGAGGVVARAVVRDLCDPLASAKIFSKLMLVMGVAPILAPLAGGWLLEHASWRWIFITLTLLSGLSALAVTLWLPETHRPQAPHIPLRHAGKQYLRLLGNRLFVSYALSGGLVMAGMFAYIAGSPYVFIELYGVPPDRFGWVFGANAAGFILAAQVNAWLMRYAGPQVWLSRIMLLHLTASLVLLAVSAWQPEQLWPLLLPLFIGIASLGCLLPNASACAMSGQAAHAGSASALLGFIQFAIAGVSSALVGVLHDGSAWPMALVISSCAAMALLSSLLARYWQAGRPLR